MAAQHHFDLSPQGLYLALALPYKTAMDCTKTLKLRIKDKHASVLCQMAREVNQVWNHVNATSAKAAWPFHGGLQQMRRRECGQWHRATGLRDVSSAKLVKTKWSKAR